MANRERVERIAEYVYKAWPQTGPVVAELLLEMLERIEQLEAEG